MRESIIIKNLGPLHDVTISDIKPLTVLIGESGSGKSLLMKTLILFRYIYKMLNIRWYLKNSNVNRSRFKLSIGSLLSPELKPYFKNNKQLEVHYKVEINGNVHSVIYRNGSIDRKTTDCKIPDKDLAFLKESWISEMRNIIPEWSDYSSSGKRRILDFYSQETFNDFKDAISNLEYVDLNYIGLSLYVDKRADGKKIMIKPLDGSYQPMEWKYASSGVQTSSSIMALIRYFSRRFSFKDAISRSIISYLYESEILKQYKPGLEPMEMKKYVQVHIEEPELNLFPDAQCRLIEDIVKCALSSELPDRQVNIIMATHSPYITNYLNVLLHRKEGERASLPVEKMAVYRIYDGSLQPLMAIDENRQWFVDTSDLTEQMQSIMNEYADLTR